MVAGACHAANTHQCRVCMLLLHARSLRNQKMIRRDEVWIPACSHSTYGERYSSLQCVYIGCFSDTSKISVTALHAPHVEVAEAMHPVILCCVIFRVRNLFSAAPISKCRGRARLPAFMLGARTSKPWQAHTTSHNLALQEHLYFAYLQRCAFCIHISLEMQDLTPTLCMRTPIMLHSTPGAVATALMQVTYNTETGKNDQFLHLGVQLALQVLQQLRQGLPLPFCGAGAQQV